MCVRECVRAYVFVCVCVSRVYVCVYSHAHSAARHKIRKQRTDVKRVRVSLSKNHLDNYSAEFPARSRRRPLSNFFRFYYARNKNERERERV